MLRSIRAPLSLLAGAATFAACAPAEQSPAVDVEAETQTIARISTQWLEYQRARDAAGIANLFAEDGVALYTGEQPWEGREAILAGTESDFAENPNAECDWSTISIEISSAGDMAWERGQWACDPDGSGEAPGLSGSYLTVFKKVDGEWKAAADVTAVHPS